MIFRWRNPYKNKHQTLFKNFLHIYTFAIRYFDFQLFYRRFRLVICIICFDLLNLLFPLPKKSSLCTLCKALLLLRKSSEFLSYIFLQCNARDSIKNCCGLCANRVSKNMKRLCDCGRDVFTGKSLI